MVTPGGVASVLSINGLASALGFPTSLAFDGAGNLYISDYSKGRVVEVSTLVVAGSTSTGMGTVIGTGSYTTSAEGITGVAVDSMGNIYIPDGYAGADPSRVIKVTAAGVVSLLTPTGITFSHPEGVSVDGMGNIYVADGGNNRIVEITTAGMASVLAINSLPTPATLGSPFGVTVDPSGNLYIPDSGNNRILFVNVSGTALTFPITAKGATSAAQTATVTNLGNQPLEFSTNPTYTANFSENAADTNPCTSSTSLSSSMSCDVSVHFTPQSVGSLSAGITVTNNTLNVAGSTQQVSVSGTSYSSTDTTSTTLTISPTSLVDGHAATLTAVVSDTTTPATVPTGGVSFTDTVGTTVVSLNGGAAVSLVAGTATLQVTPTVVGVHTITANFVGVHPRAQCSPCAADCQPRICLQQRYGDAHGHGDRADSELRTDRGPDVWQSALRGERNFCIERGGDVCGSQRPGDDCGQHGDADGSGHGGAERQPGSQWELCGGNGQRQLHRGGSARGDRADPELCADPSPDVWQSALRGERNFCIEWGGDLHGSEWSGDDCGQHGDANWSGHGGAECQPGSQRELCGSNGYPQLHRGGRAHGVHAYHQPRIRR